MTKETKKELLNRLGEDKFKIIFGELMAIGIRYEIEPEDIRTILKD